MYEKLEALFGREHTSNEIIQLSSGSVERTIPKPNSVCAPISILDSDDEQEVDSPGLCLRKPIRKRLFDAPEGSSNRALISVESNTANVDEETVKKLSVVGPYPPTNAFPRKPLKWSISLHPPKKDSSSCASSSPHKSFYSPSGKN